MSTSYSDLVNVSGFWKKREDFVLDRGQIAYWCHDCSQIVSVISHNDENPLAVECSLCHGKNLAVATSATMDEYYARRMTRKAERKQQQAAS